LLPILLYFSLPVTHARKSTIITSQLPVKNWYDILAKNTTVADAVLDRLAKTAHRIELSGDSMRK